LPHAVFISHSSEDSSGAEGVCVALEAAGIHCWIAPRDVLAGRPYSGQITEAIRRTEILLVVLSQASNRSKQVLREVERAAHFKVALLAFKIESVEPLGGMGVTYKAIDTRLDKPVALKVIGAELLNSPQARRRFLREAQTAAKIGLAYRCQSSTCCAGCWRRAGRIARKTHDSYRRRSKRSLPN
jgi:hypothetical protein